MAACSWTPSNPAALACSAAVRYVCTMPGSSSASSARGTGYGTFEPSGRWTSASAATAEGATGSFPPGWNAGCEARPTCHSWQNIVPPDSCTAAVTFFHPATCSSVNSPGTPTYPRPSGQISVASERISPAVARSR